MFTKQNIGTIQSDLKEALVSVSKRHGITLTLGTVRFNNEQFKSNITGISGGEDSAEVTNARYASDFFSMAASYGLKKSDLGRKFITRSGKSLSLVGGRSRAKLPFIGKDDSGKMFQVTVEEVVEGFAKYEGHKAPAIRPGVKPLEEKPTFKDPGLQGQLGPGSLDDLITVRKPKAQKAEETSKNLKYDPKAVAHFKKNASKFGLTPSWFAKPFKIRGKTYTIAGSQESSGDIYILGRDDHGDDRAFRVESVLKGL